MKQYTVTEYEKEDFDKLKAEMSNERAAELLARLPRGWFPYNHPDWSEKITTSDYENYEMCCAIWKAIDALTENGIKRRFDV